VESKYEVDWVEEMGYDVPRLWMEHPGHPQQIKNKKLILQRSELYWANRHLESMWADDGVEL